MLFKGISPVIATVLLIAFVVAIAGILVTWLSSTTSIQTQSVQTATDKAAKCGGSSLVVKEVRYPSTGATGRVNVTVTYESGTEILLNLTVEVSARGNTTTNSSSDSLSPGQSRGIHVASAQIPPEVVRARSFCQDTFPVAAECKSGEKCMAPV